MPHIMLRNIGHEAAHDLARTLSPILAEAMSCPADWVTISRVETVTYLEGEPAPLVVFAEVAWFRRSPATQDRVAQILTEAIRAQGAQEVVIYFTELDRRAYYENGELYE